MLEGFTTVIAAFFVFCLYRQDLIKNRSYYWATFFCLIGVIIFGTLVIIFGENATYGRGFSAIMRGVCITGAFVLTLAYVGGVSVKQLAGEMKDAAEDIRSGGEAKKPVIVPLTGQKPAPKDAYVEEEREQAEKPRIVIELPKKGDGAIPLE